MSDDETRGKQRPTIKDRALAEHEARRAREAAALRANLRRRKQQVRDRAVKAPEDTAPDESDGADHPAADTPRD